MLVLFLLLQTITNAQTTQTPGYKRYDYNGGNGYEWKYEMNCNTENCIYPNDKSVYIFNNDHIKQSEHWPENKISVHPGHSIQMNLNLKSSTNIKIAKGELVDQNLQNKLISVELIYPAQTNNYGIQFSDLQESLDVVKITFLQQTETRGTSGICYLKGAEGFSSKIKYEISYELKTGETSVDFTKYHQITFENNNNYQINLMNIPTSAMYTKQRMNIDVSIGFPLPEKYHKQVNDKVYYTISLLK